ncbi:MAG TPA: hypothetical protein VGR47_11300 [Terracidiphilus sp.]|nr:hypothetical protein [Terracidiphilus sp.]
MRRSLLGVSVQRTKAAIDYLGAGQVMITDRLTESPRSNALHVKWAPMTEVGAAPESR